MKILVVVFCTLFIGFTTSPVQSQQSDRLTEAQSELVGRADAFIANYQFEKALDLLASGDSLDIGILLRIGQCKSSLGASGAAIIPYEKVLTIDSLNLPALNHVAHLYARNGDYAKALSSVLQLIKLDPTNSYYYKEAGDLASRVDDIVGARVWFRRALELNPSDMEAALGLGNTEMKFEAFESVDSIVQRALAIDPHFRPLILLGAKSAFQLHHYESAIQKIQQLLEKSDTTAAYARLLGESYFHLHDYYNVVTCMTFLLKNRYDYDWIYYYMGVATRELGDAASAVTWFKLAVEKSISDNTNIYYAQLGQSYEEMGDYQGAIRAYRSAYDNSRDGILLYHLARTYDAYYKDKTTAAAYYQKYLESDDTIRRAKEYARKRMQDMGYF